jgi:hypothetical protein
MQARLVLAGGALFEAVLPMEQPFFARLECFFGNLKDFRTQTAIPFYVVQQVFKAVFGW